MGRLMNDDHRQLAGNLVEVFAGGVALLGKLSVVIPEADNPFVLACERLVLLYPGFER